MEQQTLLLMGPSGSGKGTQAKLLEEYLKKHDKGRSISYVRVGGRFRELAAGESHTGGLVKNYIENGRLVPEFLTVWAWSVVLIEEMTSDRHLIFDGSPRRLKAAKVLDAALEFYKRKLIKVAVRNVSKEWSRERLTERGRSDDLDKEDVERRLSWYDTEVIPVIDFFRNSDRYEVFDINSEQTIEEVHDEAVKTLFT